VRKREPTAPIPPHLAEYSPADWDGRRGRWLEARQAWAQENAPALWPAMLAEFLRFPDWSSEVPAG